MLQLGGHFDFSEAGPDEAENVLEELAASERRFDHQRQLVLVLDLAQRHNQGRGQRGKKVAAKASGQRGAVASQIGNRGLGWVEAGKLDAGLRGQPLNCGNRRRTGNDLNLRSGNFGGSLGFVAAIGKEARRTARDGQRGAGACETGEIAEIGQMGDQQAVKAGFGQTAAEKADAAKVVHLLRITGYRG